MRFIKVAHLSENKENSCAKLLEEKLEKIVSCNLLNEDMQVSNANSIQKLQSPSNDNYKCNLPKITCTSSDTLVGASDAIRIDYNDGMGRHIVANRDITPGDVLVIERPYASVLLPSAYNLYCFNCLKRCHTLIPCIHCTKVLFCSENCRNDCWSRCHSFECPILEHLISLGCTKLELLAVRTLLVVTKTNKIPRLKEIINRIDKKHDNETLKGLDENNLYRSDNYATVHWLATNTQKRTKADLFRRCCFAVVIIHYIDSLSDYFQANQTVRDSIHFSSEYSEEYCDNKFTAGSLLLKFLQIMPCNAHEVSEMCLTKSPKGVVHNDCDCCNTVVSYDSIEIGGALYPLLSLINHSCDPNVVRHSYDGDTVVLTAIQAVRQGDQIFDNYGYHHAVHDRQIRQSNLLYQYHFVCKCIACEEDWPLYDSLPSRDIIYKSHHLKSSVATSSLEFKNILRDTLAGNYSIENLNKFLDHLSLLQSAVERPWKEYSECQEAVKHTLSMFANHYVHYVKS